MQYLEVFDEVLILARAEDAQTIPDSWQRVDGPGVSLCRMPYFLGPWGFVIKYSELRRTLSAAIRQEDATIFRVSSAIAEVALPLLQRRAQPFGLQVVGDPWESYAAGSVRHPLRLAIRRLLTWRLKKHCRKAAALAYVNERVLSKRYPGGSGCYVTAFSDVDLGGEAFVPEPKRHFGSGGAIRLISVCSLAQPYKGLDTLIMAMARCARQGLALELRVVGTGRYLANLQALAAEIDLAPRITFLGSLPSGEAIRAQLDRSDLFVLPSRTEGLPRAMIEAMARGLPCIGSRVGGIPELLAPEDMVEAGDDLGLALKIDELVADHARLAQMGERNLARARSFARELIQPRKLEFFRQVRLAAQMWQAHQAPVSLP
jgi:glycosyltransferase involved in cell wall biosynthesis